MREETPVHPFWCDDCGGKAGFTIPGCPVDHAPDCPRFGEDPMQVYVTAVKFCRETGEVIR